MPSVAIRAALPLGGRVFDPLELPGLIWFIHPDDATDIISGEINSIVDRFGGVTFSANAASNRMPLDTTERPPHQVATSLNSNDWLRAPNSTLAQSINSVGNEYTMFSFHNRTSNANALTIMAHNTATGASSHSDTGQRIRLLASSGTPNLSIEDAVGTSNYLTWAGWVINDHDNLWESWTFTHNSSGTVRFYLNGTFFASQSLTVRNPTGVFTGVHYGGSGNGVGAGIYHGPKGVCQGILSDSNISLLHNWFVNNA